MPTYNVYFVTSTREVIWRKFPADDRQSCLDRAVSHFEMLNDDHGELFEVVVLPPDGESFLDGDPQVLEFYWHTPAGQRAARTGG